MLFGRGGGGVGAGLEEAAGGNHVRAFIFQHSVMINLLLPV